MRHLEPLVVEKNIFINYIYVKNEKNIKNTKYEINEGKQYSTNNNHRFINNNHNLSKKSLTKNISDILKHWLVFPKIYILPQVYNWKFWLISDSLKKWRKKKEGERKEKKIKEKKKKKPC